MCESGKYSVGVALLIAVMSLAGCNAPGFSGLAASGQGEQASVQALADPRGVTGPAVNAVAEAKEQYRERNFGLAADKFKAIVETDSSNAEAWLGLAASYDQLKRFDLADRSYGQVAKLVGESGVLHNNRGYSYLLRGDRIRARSEFGRAQALDPRNDYIRNNVSALDRRS
jgi:Flp pilus assembly protein TadD